MTITHIPEPTAEILDRITDGFVVLDRDWNICYLNAAAERMIGRTRDELLGKVIWEEYPDAVGTIFEESYRRAAAEQVTVEFEALYQPLRIWAQVHIYPSPTGLSIYVQDITRRKETELALAASEARYRLIAETAYEGIWLVDADYHTLWCNGRMAEILGFASPDQMQGVAVPDIVFEEDRPELQRKIAERRRGIRSEHEMRLRRADGRVIWALIRTSPVLDPGGSFAGALAMISDISERKRFEQDLMAQREWFRVTLSSIGDAVIATDSEGRVTFMNLVAEQLTAWPQAEAIGQPLPAVFHIVNEQTRQPVEDPVSKVLRENRIVGLANHTALIARDGSERSIDDSGAPIRDGQGRIIGVVLVFRDNTEKARAEEALREAGRRKDEFLAMLAHELRNPLAPIRSAIEVMRLRPEDPDILRHAREIVERQVQHMSRLVDDLLDVSRITRGKINLRRERVELAAVIERAVETIRPLIAARRQQLAVELPPEPVFLEADPVRLAQVIGNLLHNACKYTPDAGSLELAAALDGDAAVVTVADSGAGIRPDELARIFEPFVQLDPPSDPAQTGLGIGLTLVKALIEMHGGRVIAHSDGPGRGSRFTLRVPVVASPRAAGSGARTEAAVGAGLRTILVVDDNVDAAETLAMLLSALGYRARTARDAESALAEIRRDRPDLVLLDIGLPEMDGYELAGLLRRERGLADLKLIALTGYGQEEDQRRAREAGFDLHLVKPVELDTLTAAFARLFSARPQP